MLKPYNGFAYAYVEQWQVFSGFNRNESFRKSAFKTMKPELPYMQALLDLGEIHARQFAALEPGELPQARGDSFEEARAELTRLLEARLAAAQQAGQTEMDAFAKATANGARDLFSRNHRSE